MAGRIVSDNAQFNRLIERMERVPAEEYLVRFGIEGRDLILVWGTDRVAVH